MSLPMTKLPFNEDVDPGGVVTNVHDAQLLGHVLALADQIGPGHFGGHSHLQGQTGLAQDGVVLLHQVLADGCGIEVHNVVLHVQHGVVVVVLGGVLAHEVAELEGQVQLQLGVRHDGHGNVVRDNGLAGQDHGAAAAVDAVLLHHVLQEFHHGGGGSDPAFADQILGHAPDGHFLDLTAGDDGHLQGVGAELNTDHAGCDRCHFINLISVKMENYGFMPSPLGRVPPEGAGEVRWAVPDCTRLGEGVLPSSVSPCGLPPSPEGKAFLRSS